MNKFKEYTDNGGNYKSPKRKNESDVLNIRVYCNHKGCKKYIKGKEGYNGAFTAKTGQIADLRNQIWLCYEHEPL